MFRILFVICVIFTIDYIQGHLIGMGTLVTSKDLYPSFKLTVSTKLESHLKILFGMLKSIGLNIMRPLYGFNTLAGGIISFAWACYSTSPSEFLIELYNYWYPGGIKTLPADLVITPIILAGWYAEVTTQSGKGITISTRFNAADATRLCDMLMQQHSLKCTIQTRNKRNRIYIWASSKAHFMELVGQAK